MEEKPLCDAAALNKSYDILVTEPNLGWSPAPAAAAPCAGNPEIQTLRWDWDYKLISSID